MPTPTTNELDQATIDLIFCLRDSLTDDGPSRLDFWGGRATSALETAAAGADNAAQALTIACHKLQITTLTTEAAKQATKACQVIDQDFPAWQAHVNRTLVYVVALAKVMNSKTKPSKKNTKADTPAAHTTSSIFDKEPNF